MSSIQICHWTFMNTLLGTECIKMMTNPHQETEVFTDQDVLYLVLATLDVVKHHVLEDVLAVLQLVHLVVRVRVEHRPAKELSQRLQWGETLSPASGGMWGGQQLRQGWVFIEPCSYIFLHFYWICMMLKNAMLFICFFIKNKNNTMKNCIVDN